jgi:DNA-binding response OmpR family regulator
MDMTGFTSGERSNYTALLFQLDSVLAESLEAGLATCNCAVMSSGNGIDQLRADIVFCPAVPGLIGQALRRFRGKPVVVVSRMPEVEGWLDALEIGAADYCMSPFDAAQLKWLLETHLRSRKAVAAA